MKTTDRMFETVIPTRSPPGSCQTATASTRMIAMLRRCLPRSGPTTVENSWGWYGRPRSRCIPADPARAVLEGDGLGLGAGRDAGAGALDRRAAVDVLRI